MSISTNAKESIRKYRYSVRLINRILNTKETDIKLVTDEITNTTTLNKVKEKIIDENNSITSVSDINNLKKRQE